jgi:hypothetical protein
MENFRSISTISFLVAELPHWHYDTFYGPIGEAGQYSLVATFGLNAEGKIATLNIDGP